MIKMGVTPLLLGNIDSPFQLKKNNLPERDVNVLRDEGMGQADIKKTWPGGDVLMLQFEGGSKVSPFNFFLGEVNLISKDLWDFAVQFRAEGGRFNWPDYWALLQCPFCAKLASPPQSVAEAGRTYIMIVQFIMQIADNGAMPQRALPRLCCKDCFINNLQPNGFEWGNFPRAKKAHSLLSLCKQPDRVVNAYALSFLFEDSGMCSAASRMMAEIMSGSSGNTFKTRISKSMTRKNRDQPVVKMKIKKEKQCSKCGIVSNAASKCAGCQGVYYCGRECQKQHWKVHKTTCSEADAGEAEPQPSTQIIYNKNKKDNTNLCKCCKSNHDDTGGNPAMCFACGYFICCGPCYGKPEMNGKNSMPSTVSLVCMECKSSLEEANDIDIVNKPGVLLRRLLDKSPTGRYVQYARLILAQFMINDTEKITGIRQNVESATKEYLWLANDGDYALAQIALATFYDPVCTRNGEHWDGPTMIHSAALYSGVEIPIPKSPFQPNKNLAIHYYDRAVEQKSSFALCVVGTMYKNADGVYPRDMNMAMSMLGEAADMGETKAMGNLGRLLVNGDDMPRAFDLFCRAAEYGNYQSMFTVAQLGMRVPDMFETSRAYMEHLIDIGYALPTREFDDVFLKVCSFYGVTPP